MCLFNLMFKIGIPVFSTAASHCYAGQVCLNSKHKCSLLLDHLGIATGLYTTVLNGHRQSFAELFHFVVPVLWGGGSW